MNPTAESQQANSASLSSVAGAEQRDSQREGMLESPIAPTFSSGDADVYQSLSRAAIASAVLGVLGLGAFAVLLLIVLPVLGVVFGLLALSAMVRFPEEMLGKPLAIAGLVLCAATCLLAPAYHTYVYMTEVPEGYTRVNFEDLKSGLGQPDVPPSEALGLNGEQIFIKGYIHPTSMDTMSAKRFVLVPDLGTCCFGGQPPLTHMIEVSLTGDQHARKSYRRQRLAGKLRVNSQLKPLDDLTGVYYQLQADILK